MERVKANVMRFLDKRLKYINPDKSSIVPSTQLEFLGFTFRGTKIAWCDKALVRFIQRVRQLTGRSWGVSLTYRYRELRKYVVGWLNYFALAVPAHPSAPRHQDLRVQCRNTTDRSPNWMNGYGGACVAVTSKQWRWPSTKIKHLVSLGVSLKEAIKTGVSSKELTSYCTPIT